MNVVDEIERDLADATASMGVGVMPVDMERLAALVKYVRAAEFYFSRKALRGGEWARKIQSARKELGLEGKE